MGLRYDVPMDTLMHNFYSTDIPSSYSTAYGTTGNLGGAAFSKIFFDRNIPSEFFFKDPFSHWIQTASTWKFYNTHIPFTQLSYLTGGSKQTAQDDLKAVFSGNINPRLALGGSVNYILSRGHYQHQATKDLAYSIFGSYLGDRYDIQFFLNTYNFVNQENGGITDDTYILNPEEVQGGQSSVDTRTIPTNLSDAYNRIRGQEYYATQRYKFGFYQEEQQDTTVIRTFVPVTSIIHTIEYNANKHRFVNQSATEDTTYFANTYMSLGGTNEETTYQSLRNTVGISLLEGFNKWAKAGLRAFVTSDLRHFTLPDSVKGESSYNEHNVSVGAQLIKAQGSALHYDVTAETWLLGEDAGQLKIDGRADLNFKLFKDTVTLAARAFFHRVNPTFYYRHYHSKHLWWDNGSLDKEIRSHIEGELTLRRTRTKLRVAYDNLQNYTYLAQRYNITEDFGRTGNTVSVKQNSSNMSLLTLQLAQDFKFGPLNWENLITYQKSSDENVLPVPQLNVYTNLYLHFKIAKVLSIDLGGDLRFFTKYKAPDYSPALSQFTVQDNGDANKEIGNYPIVNVYANMHLKHTRFFIMMSHVNASSGDSFLVPHYPINGRLFRFGVSWNFFN